MLIKSSGTCRGDGKIYIRLLIQKAPENARFGIVAKTSNGTMLPCNLYRSVFTEKNLVDPYYVAVFPDLNIRSATYTIFNKLNPDDSCTLTLNFAEAKWRSRLNYKLNRNLCTEIRGFDKISTYENANFEYWECIDDVNECILRGSLRMPFFEDSSIELLCYDLRLNKLQINPVVLCNSKVTTDVSLEVCLREIQVSIRLPKPTESVVFIIRDNQHPELNSFNTLPKDILDALLAKTAHSMLSAQFDPNYPDWFNQHKASIDVLAKETATFFDYRPRYSIVVPLFNTPNHLFKDMIDSVIKQSYGKWELILVNASPNNANLASLAKDAASSDERIHLIVLPENRGISENTNAGIERAQGDFVCFFDHDDLLEPDLLFEYTKAINQYTDIDVLYCDEDKLMPDGKFGQPFFKPDFNLDLLRNNNYICHMLTIRKELLDSLPQNTREFDGAQDHNLTLLAVEKARRVHHVARILYHWRISEASTAADANNKPYATQAGIRAVQNHLDRMGIEARVTQSRRPFTYRVKYDVPSPHPLVSIIIPTKDHADVLKTCVSSILEKTTYDNYEIILVENNSMEPDTFTFYQELTNANPLRIHLITWKGEFNFSKLVNFGAQHAAGDYLLLLNNDTEVITPNWIEELIGICARNDVGAVGCRLYYRDNTIQHAGACVTGIVAGHIGKNLPRGKWGYFALTDATQDLSAVTAACMLTKRSAFEAVGGFTEELSVAFNDIDYCLKIRNENLFVVYTPEVELYHYESLSRGFETSVSKKIRFHKEISYMNYKWADYYIKGDPYINSNLTRAEPFNCYYHL